MAASFDASRNDISNAAKCVLGGWFAKMRPGTGELTFQLSESKPREWVVAALLELIGAGIISVRAFNEYGGLVFTPVVDCHDAFVWMMKGGDKAPEAKLPLTEPLKSRQAARKFQQAFLASAMSAGTAATTQIGAGLQPASAVANGETPQLNPSGHLLHKRSD